MDPARLFKMHAQFQTIPTSPNMGILSPVPVPVQPLQDQILSSLSNFQKCLHRNIWKDKIRIVF